MASGTAEIIIRARDEAGDVISGVGRALTTLKGGAEDAGRGVGLLGGALSALRGNLGSVTAITVAVTALHAALGLLGRAADAIKSSFIGFNAALESNRTAFTNMLGSAQNADAFLRQLSDFANKTSFRFDELTTASQRMLAFGFSAQQVIPLLTAVGNQAALLGGGSEQIDRLTLALGQMQAKGKVSGDELLQLSESGVKVNDVFAIIAKQSGKTADQIAADAEKGKLASSDFIAAFEQYAGRFGNVMGAQSRTFSGAISTIQDTLQSAGARAFKPFFDLIRDGAITVADFLQSDKFQSFIDVITVGAQRAADGIRALFRTFQEGGVSGVLDSLKAKIADALDLDGTSGGRNFIVTFVTGMYDAAQGVLSTALNDIAQYVADFFIGHSPPPKGPLSGILDGGAKTMDAFLDGMMQAVQGGKVSDAASYVLTALNDTLTGNVAGPGFGAMDFSGLTDAIRSGTMSMDELKAAGEGVDDVVRRIGESITDIQDKQDTLKGQIDDITYSYEDQIDPLERQLDALKSVVDWTTKQRDLELEIAQNKIEQAEAADPTLAGLNKTLAGLQQQQRNARSAPIDRTLENRIASLQQQERGLPTGQAGAARRRQLEDTIAGLRDQQRRQSDSDTDAGRALQAQIDKVKQQIDDRKAIYQTQLDSVKAEKDSVDLKAKGLELDRQLKELPLEKKIADLKQAESDRIAPLQRQVDLLDRQRTTLERQKQHWAAIASEIRDALQPLQQAADQMAKIAADAKKTAEGGLPGVLGLNLQTKPLLGSAPRGEAGTRTAVMPGGAEGGVRNPNQAETGIREQTPADKFVELGTKIGENIVKGAISYIKQHFFELIGGAIGGAVGGAVFGPAGAVIGGLLGARIGGELQKKLGELDWKAIFTSIQSGVERFATFLQNDVLPVALNVFGWLRDNVPTILGAVADFITGTALPALHRFGDWFTTTALPVLKSFGAWILSDGLNALHQLGNWFETTGQSALQKFGGFVKDDVIPAAKQLGDWFVNDGLPALRKFGDFVDQNVLPVVKRMADYFVEHMLPTLTDWWSFLSNKILPILESWWGFLLNKVVPVLGDVAGWVIDHVVPALTSMWSYIDKNVLPVLTTLWGKFHDDVLPIIKDIAKFVGETLIQTLTSLWDGIETKLVPKLDALATILKATVRPEVDLFKLAADSVLGSLKLLFDFADKTWSLIGPKLSAPFDAVKETFRNFMHTLGTGIEKIGDFFDIANISKAGAALQSLFASGTASTSGSGSPSLKATGDMNFAGGAAIIGERGRELFNRGKGWEMADRATMLHLPKGATVLPNAITEMLLKMGVPGFAGGLLGDVGGGIVTLAGNALDVARKGADAIYDATVGKLPDLKLPGVFADVGAAVTTAAKDGLTDLIKGLLPKVGNLIENTFGAIGGALTGGINLPGLSGSGWPTVAQAAAANLGSKAWIDAAGNTLCEGFSEQMERLAGYSEGYWASAAAHGYGVQHLPGFPGPIGSLMHWGIGYFPQFGHAGISMGDGTIISTSAAGIQRYSMAGKADYLGWLPPGLASGGIVTKDGVYRLAEGNNPEAVIPLGRGGSSGNIIPDLIDAGGKVITTFKGTAAQGYTLASTFKVLAPLVDSNAKQMSGLWDEGGKAITTFKGTAAAGYTLGTSFANLSPVVDANFKAHSQLYDASGKAITTLIGLNASADGAATSLGKVTYENGVFLAAMDTAIKNANAAAFTYQNGVATATAFAHTSPGYSDLFDPKTGKAITTFKGHMAHGGITTEEGPYYLHPNEAVIPLDKAGDKIGGGDVYNITVNVPNGAVLTEGQLVDTIHTGLLKKKRYNTTLGLS